MHDTIPFVLWTTLRRLGNLEKTCDSGGNSDGVARGILSYREIVNGFVHLDTAISPVLSQSVSYNSGV